MYMNFWHISRLTANKHNDLSFKKYYKNCQYATIKQGSNSHVSKMVVNCEFYLCTVLFQNTQ